MAPKRKRSLPATPLSSPSAASDGVSGGAAVTRVKCGGEDSLRTENLKDVWEQGLLLDATIKTDQRRTIRAHMVVLAAHSPYIRGLLTSGLAESSSSAGAEISLLDVDHGAMKAIVDCLYTGEIALTLDNATLVLKAANMLQLTEIEKAACGYIIDQLQPETAIAALTFAEQLAACGSHGEELHRKCLEYVHGNFAECAQSADFLGLEAEALGQLIGSDSLKADPDEGVVLGALRYWFEHDRRGRETSVQVLLPLVRFPLLPQALQLGLDDDPLLAVVPEQMCLQLMKECFPGFAESAAAAGCPRLVKRRHRGQEFEFASVQYKDRLGRFDKKGVLYHIATEGGTSAWVNPHDAGRVVASASVSGLSLDFGGHNCSAAKFVSGPDEDPGDNYTGNICGSWFKVDLGSARALVVNHYALRHGDVDDVYGLRNWKLQGAATSDGPWTTLRNHDNDSALESKKHSVAAWAVEGAETAFRFFRVFQHGKNAEGDDHLMCGGIELYGTLTETV